MNATDLSKTIIHQIEEGLKTLHLPERPTSLYEPYRYAIDMGGKRIRPMMTVLACGMCGGRDNDAIPAALAVEILHNFTLVHDDIMDSADTRRGKPSVFNKWNENVAILSGDVMFADAFRRLNYYGNSDSFTKTEFGDIHKVFQDAVITVCEGQALDMEFVDRQDVTLEEYIEMIAGKTAALLSGALEMGAIAAHTTAQQRQELHQLGYEMGVAFQIQDDLLDATADPERFGKRPGGDIFEGKKTYLTILSLERANEEQTTIIRSTLDDINPPEQSVEAVLQIMNDLGVIKDTQQEVNKRYLKANELISHFDDSKYKKELQNLLIFLQKRDH